MGALANRISPPSPAVHRPVRDQIVAAIRREIELGELKSGQRLVEKNLCERFGVSRPPLREALRELEANGVIRKVATRTVIVASPDSAEIEQIGRVRAAIEMMLAERFCDSATPAQIDALQQSMRAIEQADGTGAGYLDANRHYYRCWCEGAGNGFALELLTNIQLRLAVVRGRGLPVAEIRAMNLSYQRDTVAMLARRDAGRAVENVRQHNRAAIMALLANATPAQFSRAARPARRPKTEQDL